MPPSEPARAPSTSHAGVRGAATSGMPSTPVTRAPYATGTNARPPTAWNPIAKGTNAARNVDSVTRAHAAQCGIGHVTPRVRWVPRAVGTSLSGFSVEVVAAGAPQATQAAPNSGGGGCASTRPFCASEHRRPRVLAHLHVPMASRAATFTTASGRRDGHGRRRRGCLPHSSRGARGRRSTPHAARPRACLRDSPGDPNLRRRPWRRASFPRRFRCRSMTVR